MLDGVRVVDQFRERVARGFVLVRERLGFVRRRDVPEPDRDTGGKGSEPRSERSRATSAVSSASWMSRSASRSRRITLVTGAANAREIVRPQRSIAPSAEPMAVTMSHQ